MTDPLRAAVTAVLIVLAGCGDGRDESGTSATTVTTASSEVEALADLRAVTMVKSGGVAGVHLVTTVSADGTVTVDGTRTGDPPEVTSLSNEDWNHLRALVSSPEFATLAADYVPDDACCDLFAYELTVQFGDETTTIRTASGLDTPPVLQEVVTFLDGLG